MINTIDYSVNLVEMDETYNPMMYEDLPLSYQDTLDEMARMLFDPNFGKFSLMGSTDSGKTFFLHQLVANIDRYLDKLGKSKMVFIRVSAAEIRKLEMANVDPNVFISTLCDQFNCDYREICFVGNDETAIEAIHRVFSKCRAIFEINLEKADRNTSATYSVILKNYAHIEVNDILLKKSELVKLLNESVTRDIQKIFKIEIDEKTVSAFVNYVIRFMPEIILTHNPGTDIPLKQSKRDPYLAAPAGIWAKAIRRIGSTIALSESPLIRTGEEIAIAKVMSRVFNDMKSSFEYFLDTDEDEDDLSSLPKELREIFGIRGAEKNISEDATDIPDFNDIDELMDEFKKEIIGQDDALESIIEGLVVPAAGMNDKDKPVRSYLLLGPTGTGKTKTALTLAANAFEREMNVIRIDMSEFGEAHESSKLIGSPPGYVGHGTGGMLTNAVKEHPNSLVLLDEIEKAHPRVWDSFLQVLDAGRLTDSDGDVVDFTSTIIVMTSNVGVKELTGRKGGYSIMSEAEEREERHSKSKEIMLKALEKTGFRPEFINRIDEVVVFKSLSRETSRAIVQKEIDTVSDKMSDNGFILNEVDSKVIDQILDLSDIDKFGAREVQRVIYRNISIPISRKMINIQKEENKEPVIAINKNSKSSKNEVLDIETDYIKKKKKGSKIGQVDTIEDLVALEENGSEDCILNLKINSDNKIVVY